MGNCQKSFGITIRLLRLSRKLKQEQLAEKSGLSLRHIKSIERGLSDPTLSTLEKIASALSLRVKELFALEASGKLYLFSWKTVTIAIYFDSMLATRFFCPSTSKILSNQNRFVAHLLLALSNSPYPRGCVEPFFLKRTYGEYKKTGRQIALSARLLSYGAEGETRTPMKEPSLDPEPSVSTNSTTSARRNF